jgi:prepilin-type N-terminal cleavage/methylation domain-containing protein
VTGNTLRGNPGTFSGFTLIEVLIALVIMTVGMLGLSAIYIESLRLNRSAVYHHAAISLAADMAERLRASSPGQPAENERVAWEREVSRRLPNGSKANIRPSPFDEKSPGRGVPTDQYDIQLRWPETGQKTPASYTLTVRLPNP